MKALMKYLEELALILFTLVMVMESKTDKSLMGPLGESLRFMTLPPRLLDVRDEWKDEMRCLQLLQSSSFCQVASSTG